MIGTKHTGGSMKIIQVIGALIIMPWLHAQDSQLQKLFFHTTGQSQAVGQNKTLNKNALSLELSKLVFYFSQEPIITLLPNYKNNRLDGQITATFFFPKAEISSSEARQMVAHCNQQKESFYTMHVAPITKPINGIQLVITYDPKQIAFEHDSFEAIGGQKGIVFTFYDKNLLERLKLQTNTVLQTASATLPTVVIDCGHGGNDTGACGFFNIVEKELTQTIGHQLAHYVHERGWNVVLTRHADEYLALDERTSCANKTKADFLISLHANHASNEQASGIETFCFDRSLLKPLSAERVSQELLIKKMSDNLSRLSNLLATSIHQELLNAARTQREVIDRKVKRAVPQLLLGSTIPAILIELGFVSNKQEAQFLVDPAYQQALVKGIYQGMLTYLKKQSLITSQPHAG